MVATEAGDFTSRAPIPYLNFLFEKRITKIRKFNRYVCLCWYPGFCM